MENKIGVIGLFNGDSNYVFNIDKLNELKSEYDNAILDITDRLLLIRPHPRLEWCDASICGCMGCVNNHLSEHGLGKEDFDNWLLNKNRCDVVNGPIEVITFVDKLNSK